MNQLTDESREKLPGVAGARGFCFLAVRRTQGSLVHITEVAARVHLRHLIMKIHGSGQTGHRPSQSHFFNGDPLSTPSLNQQLIFRAKDNPLVLNSCFHSFASVYTGFLHDRHFWNTH